VSNQMNEMNAGRAAWPAPRWQADGEGFEQTSDSTTQGENSHQADAKSDALSLDERESLPSELRAQVLATLSRLKRPR